MLRIRVWLSDLLFFFLYDDSLNAFLIDFLQLISKHLDETLINPGRSKISQEGACGSMKTRKVRLGEKHN